MTQPDGPGDDAPAEPVAPPRRRGRLIIRLLGVVLVVTVGVLAYQVTRTALALRQATTTIASLQGALETSNLLLAGDEADALADQAATAHRHSDGVLWGLATRLPVLGDDAAAVRDMSAALDTVARVGPEGVAAVDGLSGQQLRSRDGGVDLGAVRRLAPALRSLDDATARASAEVDQVDPDGLVGPLATRAEDFLDRLATLREAASSAEVTVRLLPRLLGQDRPQRYLLVFQNNAEVRATGGLPGAFAELTARDGRVRLGFQGSAADLQGGRVGSFEPGERELFGPELLDDVRDANFTPDFPRAASLMRLHAQASLGQRYDGVLSIDPVTLAQLLRVTGPEQVGGVTLDADSALRLLLLEPYQRLGREAQDAFFAAAAKGVVDRLLSADVDSRGLLRVLRQGAVQRRVLLWSADPQVQRELDGFAVAGALPRDSARPEVGFYLNDGMGAKIQYFLRYDGRVESLSCEPDGSQRVLVEMVLRSEVPQPVSQLSESVTGNGRNGPKGDQRLVVRMFAPVGGQLEELSVDGEAQSIGEGEVAGREVSSFVAELAPGETRRVQVVYSSGPDQPGAPRLEWTPSMAWGPSGATAPSTC